MSQIFEVGGEEVTSGEQSARQVKCLFSFVLLYLSFALPFAGTDAFLPSQTDLLSLATAVTCNEHLQGRPSLIQMSQDQI